MVASGAIGTQAVAKVRAHGGVSVREATKVTVAEALLQAASACDAAASGGGAGDEDYAGGPKRAADDGTGDATQPAAKAPAPTLAQPTVEALAPRGLAS